MSAPAFVAEAAERETAALACHVDEACSHHAEPDSAIAAPPLSPCCEAAQESSHATCPESAVPEPETVCVIGVLVQQCQGHGAVWNSLPWAVLTGAEQIERHVDPVAWEAPVSSGVAAIRVEPPKRPPRRVTAVILGA